MIYWAQLLHFYQPPTQLHQVLTKVGNESYRPLLRVLREHPQARITVNINGVLSELLDAHGQRDVLEGLRELAERGQIEFTGSGKYHPLLPLVPAEERLRSITQNHSTNQHLIGQAYAPRGFFPPELAYSAEVAGEIVSTRHEWVLLSGVACPAPWPVDGLYEAECGGDRLALVFRDDVLSNKISFQNVEPRGFLDHLRAGDAGNRYVVTAMDAETFGHHIPRWEERFLAATYAELAPDRQARRVGKAGSDSGIEMVTVSELVDRFPRKGVVEPRASSWSTTGEDLAAGNPFPLWHSPGNESHQLQWEHTNLCIELVECALHLADTPEARRYAGIARSLLDIGLYSCQYWWASGRPMWDGNLIYKGIQVQEEAILNACKSVRLSNAGEQATQEAGWRLLAARRAKERLLDLAFG